MKIAVVAIDATHDSQMAVENIAQGLIRLQSAGLLEEVHVASVIHPDSFLVPYAYFRKDKSVLAEQAGRELREKLDPKLKIKSFHLIVTDKQSMNDHIEALEAHARSVGADVLAVGTGGKSSLTYLLQGSFAESVSLKSEIPVLVFGEGSGTVPANPKPKVVVAFSPAHMPGLNARERIANLARGLSASLMLVPMDDQSNLWRASPAGEKENTRALQRRFAREGIASSIADGEAVLPAHIPSIAAEEQAVLTVFCSTEATAKKPFFSPSLEGRVIADMSRPILVLKDLPVHLNQAAPKLKSVNHF